MELEGRGGRKRGSERFMIWFLDSTHFAFVCMCLVFLWGIKCTRARIHPYTLNCEWTNQPTNQQQRKITTFTFCVARLPQWRLHYNLKFDQIRISHSDLLRHKWKCWKLIVDRLALQLAFRHTKLTIVWKCTKFSYRLRVFFPLPCLSSQQIVMPPRILQIFLSCCFEILYLCECVCVSCWFGYCILFFWLGWHRLSQLNQHRLHDVCHQLIRPRFDISVQLNRSQNSFSNSNCFRGGIITSSLHTALATYVQFVNVMPRFLTTSIRVQAIIFISPSKYTMHSA